MPVESATWQPAGRAADSAGPAATWLDDTQSRDHRWDIEPGGGLSGVESDAVKVFISWSGQRSRDVALALRDWLPLLINEVQGFVSSKDIYAGARWQAEIAAQLESTNFGLVCVTKDNQRSPWINFEAGALAKAVDSSRLIPLAIDLRPSEIEIPLGQFQSQPLTEAGVQEVAASLNSLAANRLKEDLLIRAVAKWWPELHTQIEDILSQPGADPRPDTRSDRELIEETLSAVRSLVQNQTRATLGNAKPQLTVEDMRGLWPEILEEVKGRRRFTWILLSQNATVAGLRGGTLQLAFATPEAAESYARGNNEQPLREALLAVTGADLWIEIDRG